jgi:DNA-binding Xre family transcriptional regulator
LSEGRKVKISYKPLWRLLLEKDMSKMDLLSVTKISTCTLSKLSKNEPLKIDTIENL